MYKVFSQIASALRENDFVHVRVYLCLKSIDVIMYRGESTIEQLGLWRIWRDLLMSSSHRSLALIKRYGRLGAIGSVHKVLKVAVPIIMGWFKCIFCGKGINHRPF